MQKIIDIKTVMITSAVIKEWNQTARTAVREMKNAGQLGRWDLMPDKQGEVSEDGSTLTIFVSIRGRRIEMVVPQGEWQWNN